jgi:hypothetical protein
VLLHGEVDHEAVGGGAVPVVLVGLEEHMVAGADDIGGVMLALAQADVFGDEDRLAVRVGVPGRPGVGVEVHCGGRERRRGLRCRCRPSPVNQSAARAYRALWSEIGERLGNGAAPLGGA